MPSTHSKQSFPADNSMKSKVFSYLQKWTYGQNMHDVWLVLLIQLNVMIYALSFWMQQPVLPFIIEKLGSELNDTAESNDGGLGSYSTIFGYFQTIVSLLRLIGGPLVGIYTDKAGAKKSLILCQIGSALSYFFLGSSTSLQLLFLSRITTVFQQVMQTAQASVAQLTSNSTREQSMGRLSMAYGIGMILGSSIGGIITKYSSIKVNAFIAASISLLVVVLDIIYLPPLKAETIEIEDKIVDNKTQNINKKQSGIFGHINEIFGLLTRPSVRGLCIFLFIAGFGTTLYRSMFSLIFKEVFKFEAKQLGFFISYVALVSTISNSFFVGYIRKRYKDDYIVTSSVIINAICLGIFGYGCMTQIIDIRGLCLLAIPQTISSSFMYIMISGYISKIVEKNEMGRAIALTHALRSSIGVVAPTLGGHLVALFSYQSIGFFGCVSGLLSAAVFSSLVTTQINKS